MTEKNKVQDFEVSQTEASGIVYDNRQVIEMLDSFYDKLTFEQSIEQATDVEKFKDIKTIIVPHHLLASQIISRTFSQIDEDIDQFVVISPNHYSLKPFDITTADLIWQTPYGRVSSDSDLVKQFSDDFNISVDGQIFENEHGIGVMMPYIKYYYPEAKVLPIVVNVGTGEKQSEDIADWLDENLTDKSMIVVSIDFSHYLSEDQAAENDQKTRKLIETRNYKEIVGLTNEFVDSPGALMIALKYADKNNLRTQLKYHQNSNDFLSKPSNDVTTYFGIEFLEN